MRESATQLREQRLQTLFDDCQQHVLAQIIGPFGLSTAMFQDKTGGNVTTAHNFAQGTTATDDDQARYARFRQSADEFDRASYAASTTDWQRKRDSAAQSGVDGYTGKPLSEDFDLDHVIPLKAVATDPRAHLALGEVKDGAASVDKIKTLLNDDANLVGTDASLNRSKSDKDAQEWARANKAGQDDKTNAEHYEVDPKRMDEAYRTASDKINATIDTSLLKKQTGELLTTGLDQAARMAVRQALGLLLTELVNGLFNEFKVLIKRGVEAGKTLFQEIRERLGRVIQTVAAKLPDAMGQLLGGGVSGFMSNLLTFLINSFITTAKRIVTALREVLLGLYRAFKLIAMRPAHMTPREAMQAALKILATVVATTVGVLLEESVSAFMLTIPLLKPFADVVSPVLVGIVSGLLSAYLAYQIDSAFDRQARDEKLLDELMADAQRRSGFAEELRALCDASLRNVEQYAQAMQGYADIGAAYGQAGQTSALTLASLEHTNAQTREQVRRSHEGVASIEHRQQQIDAFLNHL
ncbi:hypothetical protein [Cupriavidus basilensis]|uniref:Uncharacterized protein n=1 Tax=Cupriavidus basilensis TaxID=68895 RepID=A0A643FY47_9BURK|nr:hypothetical protein [Cupriavidus basilensis]QOT76591.1 hypothetical protein F7R26_000285 [Cupriavidus basilensis]